MTSKSSGSAANACPVKESNSGCATMSPPAIRAHESHPESGHTLDELEATFGLK